MTTLREAAQMALEALEQIRTPLRINTALDAYDVSRAIAALRTALAESEQGGVCGRCGAWAVDPVLPDEQRTKPEQKPVAWANMRLDGRTPTMLSISQHPEDRANWVNPVPLYAHPAPQTVELTDEDIDRVTDKQWAQNNHKPIYSAHRAYARAVIEAYQRKQEVKA